jgi:F0F1-type ATP synthase epsilon subunit
LAIDSVKLFYSDLSVALNAQLTALIATATSLKDGDNVPSDFDETAIETAITNGTAALAASDAATKQAAIDALNTAITELQTVITLNASLTSLIASATALKDDAAVPSDFDKTAIETAITNAQAALSSGDSSVKQAAIDALNTEIAALQTVIQNANTVSLADIVSGQKYLLKHVATGMYLRFLDNNDGDFCLNALPNGSNDNFDFIFTAVPGAANTYMLGINSGANTGYMSGSGWNTQLADPATASQKQIILLNQGDNIVWLRAGWLTSNVMNFDCISAACRIYANKSGSANAQFKIELSPNALDMNALIATAR